MLLIMTKCFGGMWESILSWTNVDWDTRGVVGVGALIGGKVASRDVCMCEVQTRCAEV